ncbi:MipA/OmpV family protein [Microvirga alba]|uniref:MipA/OmpV family protein n=1 Tax=Microvirga alba TaxID=2791025 RepID=A0A931BV65_9HYPH|nr:MipA/OmpV family protein [Microvirga alba]MBF9235308.1 MipA/OmpV family protein [Microvirga alba]
MHSKVRLIICSLAAGVASPAFAADIKTVPAQSTPVNPTGWIITLTGYGEVGPRYPGSDKFSVFGYPSIDYRRVGEPARWSAPDDGIDFAVLDWPNFRAGPVVRFEGGRYYGSERQLFGLRKVNWSIEPGLFAEYWPANWLRARAEVRYGVNGYDGFVGDLEVDLVRREGLYTFSIGPRVSFGDSNFARAYFSVTPFEASLNGLVTPFKAKGGVTSAGVLASASYAWSEQWTTTVYAGYRRLIGDAADSPITRRLGSADQFLVGASLSYSFVFAP